MSREEGSFLERWSRRKAAVRDGAPDPALRVGAAMTVVASRWENQCYTALEAMAPIFSVLPLALPPDLRGVLLTTDRSRRFAAGHRRACQCTQRVGLRL